MTSGSRAIVLLVVTATMACSKEPARSPSRPTPNAPVILISIDTLRSDRLPVYGYKGVATPHLDSFRRDAILFERAYSPCPMTLPSHVSMLTGQLPNEHGVRNNIGYTFDPSAHPTLPLILRERGYRTGAAVSSYVLRRETGLARAFEDYDDAIDPQPGAAFAEYQRAGTLTAALAERWIAANAVRPFFFFLHLYEPHVPYSPVEPFASRYTDPYDGEVATADAIVGTFLDRLKAIGLYDRAIIIITSDHGEGLGDHGEAQHSIFLYREALQVPLFLKLPHSQRAGQTVRSPVALIDIFPTVLELLGVPDRGRSTSARSLLSAPQAGERAIYAETLYPRIQLGWHELRSIIRGSAHLIESSEPELYDLATDPAEKRDLASDRRREVSSLRTLLAGLDTPVEALSTIDSEAAAKLSALGYIGSARDRSSDEGLPNPRDNIRYLGRLTEAFGLADRGNRTEAIDRFRVLVGENPRMVEAWSRMAELLAQEGRPEESLAAYREAISKSGVISSDLVIAMGEILLELGRKGEARKAADSVMGLNPGKARRLLIRVALAEGDLTSATRDVEAVVASPVVRPADLLLLAEVQAKQGSLAAALSTLDRAGERASGKPVSRLEYLRGDFLARSGRPNEAAAAYEKEITRFPRNVYAYTNLAVLHFISGDRRGVDRTLERMVQANPSKRACLLAARSLETLEDLRGAERWRQRASKISR